MSKQDVSSQILIAVYLTAKKTLYCLDKKPLILKFDFRSSIIEFIKTQIKDFDFIEEPLFLTYTENLNKTEYTLILHFQIETKTINDNFKLINKLDQNDLELDYLNIVRDYLKKRSGLFKKTNLELNELKQKIEEYKAGWQRARADYSNLQSEIKSKQQEWLEYSQEQILSDFLPIYDNFKKAFFHKPKKNNQKAWDNWAVGIGYIMKQFNDVLKQYQIEEIKTVGEKFDHHLHEAVGEEYGDNEDEIVREVETGYKRGDRVIKPAKVIVSKLKNN